jgi:hypothetical protein
MIALECRISGAIPLISNLVRTISAEEDPEALNLLYQTPQNQWMKEYELG